jgi:hypothetical protein
MIVIMSEDRVLSQRKQSAADRIGRHAMELGGVAYCRAAAG